jgi:hypothetical protein
MKIGQNCRMDVKKGLKNVSSSQNIHMNEGTSRGEEEHSWYADCLLKNTSTKGTILLSLKNSSIWMISVFVILLLFSVMPVGTGYWSVGLIILNDHLIY